MNYLGVKLYILQGLWHIIQSRTELLAAMDDYDCDDHDQPYHITHSCMRCGGDIISTDVMYVEDAGFTVHTSLVSYFLGKHVTEQAKLEEKNRKAEASARNRAKFKTRNEGKMDNYRKEKNASKKKADVNTWEDYEDRYNAKAKKQADLYDSRVKAQGQVLTDVEDKLKSAKKKLDEIKKDPKAAAAKKAAEIKEAAKSKAASVLSTFGFGGKKKKK